MDEDSEIGIPLDSETFHALVVRYLDKIRSGDELDVEDIVTMTRLWNTMAWSGIDKTDEIYSDYNREFFPDYVRKASTMLGALPSKGMALYAKEYDLFIGGKPHANSQYRLT